MADLSNVEVYDLIKELNSRGYKTDLVYGKQDVNWVLEEINDFREEDSQIQLDDSDVEEILDYIFLNTEQTDRHIRNSIRDIILDDYADLD